MIVVDVETTGIDPQKNSIISIGAVEFESPYNQFYRECRVDVDAQINPYALERNGFTLENLFDPGKINVDQLVESFLNWTRKIELRTIAGENPGFDREFLLQTANKYNLNWDLGYRVLDLHTLSYVHQRIREVKPPMKNGVSDLNLDDTLNYVGLEKEPLPHNALNGALREAEAFARLLFGRNIMPGFSSFEVPYYLRKPVARVTYFI
ncbi:3'-5' exoribonuclease [Candidatus Woesearchaeota archaeon]|nr:3'-5' exoribonuclease [Candidatus Woesearchaeota archaeon]